MFKISNQMIILWQCRNGMEEELANWTPLDGLDVDCVNILLIGQVGNGKSSFINTINSVFRGYVNPKAVTGNADHSLTTKVNEILLHCGGWSLGPKGTMFLV